MSINLENGSFLNINKETDTLTISFKNIKLVGDITNEGYFSNTKGISSNADISDKTSSMQKIRDIYNSHTHTGNQGKPTSSPTQQM